MTRVELVHDGIRYTFAHPNAGGVIWGAHNKGRLYEQDLLEAIRDERRAGVYIDVGAGVGNHARFFADACRAELVIAVEPAAVAQAYLHINLQGTDTPTRIVDGFCTDVPEAAWTLERGVLQADPTVTGIHGVRLDSLVNHTLLERAGERVACIKIDVEGHEPHVLRGAIKTLQAHAPLLAIEAWDGAELERQEAVLTPLGYRRRPRAYCATATYLWSKTR